MKEFYKPYDCDLKEYEARLASSREFGMTILMNGPTALLTKNL
jgi:hypothetical protein